MTLGLFHKNLTGPSAPKELYYLFQFRRSLDFDQVTVGEVKSVHFFFFCEKGCFKIVQLNHFIIIGQLYGSYLVPTIVELIGKISF